MDQLDLVKKYLSVSYWVEVSVGFLVATTLVALGILSMGIAGFSLSSDFYEINIYFNNVGGLKKGAPIELAGVQIGQVANIFLEGTKAVVVGRIAKSVKIREDDIFSVNTKGLIGDRYIKVTPGSSEIFIESGGVVTDTVDSLDIEDLIAKLVGRVVSKDD